MDDTLFQRMKEHIEENEKRRDRPYKINGQLTTGVGFKVTDADAFAGLRFKITDSKTGQTRYATDAEKRQEFERIKSMSNDQLKGDKNAFTLGKEDIDAKLKSEIDSRIGKIKGEIGDANWDKLSDGQKTAVLDIHYANGSLDKFGNLKKEIAAGNADGIAREAGFHSGGKRNWEREARNQAAILGVSQEEGRRIVQDKFKDQKPIFDGPVAPPKPQGQGGNPTPQPQPEPSQTGKPPQSTEGQTPQQPQPAPEPSQTPTPQPEPPQPEKKPEPQPTPAPEQTQSESPADPKVASMVEMAGTPIDNPGQSALLKPVEKLTQPEMTDMIHSAQEDYRGWRSGDPLKAHTYEKVQDWHVNIYGDQPQGNDGGKPIEPTPIRPIPEQPSPHMTPQGEDLWLATSRIGQKVADAAGSDGYVDAVTGLQRGLNMLNEANPQPKRSPAYGPYTKLGPVDEDGQYGPQTDFALKHATARLGPDKVDEAFALGRFNTFARNAQRGGNPEGLEDKTHSIFGPLFRDPANSKAPKVESGVLQETLNDIGGRNRDDWEPLKVDNWIGPKTTEAFRSVLQDEDADQVTRAFGRGLGLM